MHESTYTHYTATALVQIGLGVHSTSYKMSTGGFPLGYRRPCVGLAILPLPNALAVYMWTFASTSPWTFMACNEDTFTFNVVKVSELCHSKNIIV